ncbi:MAG: transcriptional repressor [Candidatus Omnitrophica bacterium]|nr:transcriptional repressor [Candidatus Omnitrophota bacterium]
MKNEKIINLLKMKGVKPSIQRVEILNYLIENKSHPSVDEIYSFLISKIPTLSKATIYNTLKILCEKKVISEILIEEDEVRYDFIEKQHMHFRCKKCKKIYDIYKKCDVVNYKDIDGHKIEEHHIYLLGVCKNCRKVEND